MGPQTNLHPASNFVLITRRYLNRAVQSFRGRSKRLKLAPISNFAFNSIRILFFSFYVVERPSVVPPSGQMLEAFFSGFFFSKILKRFLTFFFKETNKKYYGTRRCVSVHWRLLIGIDVVDVCR